VEADERPLIELLFEQEALTRSRGFAVSGLQCEYFPVGHRHARTIYEAAALPFGGKVKVIGTAVRD
jgi:hypothetical protein